MPFAPSIESAIGLLDINWCQWQLHNDSARIYIALWKQNTLPDNDHYTVLCKDVNATPAYVSFL